MFFTLLFKIIFFIYRYITIVHQVALVKTLLQAMKESINNNRPILRKASSLAAPLFVEEIRWMQLRRIELKTADGLPPLPMQISWVRDGILVVGMDSEMHVYSQWKPENPQTATGLISGQVGILLFVGI